MSLRARHERPVEHASPATLRDLADAARGDYERQLAKLVEIPTVSVDPARAADVARGARAAAELLRDMGAGAKVHATGGHPLVVGELTAGPRWPTVTVYNHLDVQPADRVADGWRTEPFRFVKKGDRYFGRGTTDDKGPALAALHGALAARRQGARVNVRFLWELEEEVSSPHFERTLARLGRRWKSDVAVISDGLWYSRRQPSALTGLRGWLGFHLLLQTARGDAHSGIVGGLARNPIAELMQLVTQMHDARTGRVKVPGFYEDVRPLTRGELAEFRRSGFSLAALRKGTGLQRMRTTVPLDAMRRTWAEPTFEVHGVVGGYNGPGQKSVVPGRAEVKVSCRLAPAQRPERVAAALRRFVKARHPEVELRFDPGACPAFLSPATGPLANALKRALRGAFGKEPSFVRGGGTIPAALILERLLRCPVLFLDLSLPEHGYHAANENFDWRQARGGIVAFARLFQEVARR